jgi:hypothetical protein
VRLDSSTQISVLRNNASNALTAYWIVVEFAEGVSVQRGDALYVALTVVPISAVTVSKSFPAVTNCIDNIDYGSRLTKAKLLSSTQLEIDGVAGSCFTSWQVAQWDDAVVQKLENSYPLGGAVNDVALPTPVDPAQSFVVGTTRYDAARAGADDTVVFRILDANTVRQERYDAAMGYSAILYVVSSPSVRVQAGLATIPAASLSQNIALALPVPQKRLIYQPLFTPSNYDALYSTGFDPAGMYVTPSPTIELRASHYNVDPDGLSYECEARGVIYGSVTFQPFIYPRLGMIVGPFRIGMFRRTFDYFNSYAGVKDISGYDFLPEVPVVNTTPLFVDYRFRVYSKIRVGPDLGAGLRCVWAYCRVYNVDLAVDVAIVAGTFYHVYPGTTMNAELYTSALDVHPDPKAHYFVYERLVSNNKGALQTDGAVILGAHNGYLCTADAGGKEYDRRFVAASLPTPSQVTLSRTETGTDARASWQGLGFGMGEASARKRSTFFNMFH